MKNYLSFVVLIGILVFVPSNTSAEQYYECVVAADTSKGTECSNLGGIVHKCQLYNGYSGSGIPDRCSGFCLNRSGLPEYCATVSVQPSTNTEAHEGRRQVEEKVGMDMDNLKDIESEIRDKLSGIENEINTEDGVDEAEVQYIIERITAVIQEIIGEKVSDTFGGFSEKVGDVKDKVIDKIPFVGENDAGQTKEPVNEDSLTDFDFDEENPFAETGLDATQPGEYRTDTWPDENGTKIAKIVDAYGVERYTSDGKHFYNNPYDATHSGEGVRNMINDVKDTFSSVTNWFWKTKEPDTQNQLKLSIAREVLSDTKSQSEKDIEKAYEKLGEKINTPTFGDVPAKAVVEVAKELPAKDFASAASVYIEEREKGNSQASIRENNSEILSEGYGTFGNQGEVSLSTKNKYAEAVLYARYEEVYQRYKIAKEFGRTE